MTNSFHNTTNLDGTVLGLSEEKAKRQERRVLKIFQDNQCFMSPQYVWHFSGMDVENIPLTSVRRAITNLTESGQLVKTKKKVIGKYGAKTHCWILKEYFKPEMTIFSGQA